MILYLRNITKTYGKTVALSDFSLTLTPGIYALLGPNGAGKSTLMNILTDNLSANYGEILFQSSSETEPINIRSLGAKFRSRIGYMPQYPGLFPEFSVNLFMQYIAALKGIGDGIKKKDQKEFIEKRIYEVLQEVDLNHVAHCKIKTLSGGMKQRLGLAQAVLGDPAILILDEPTAGLDPKQRIAIRNYISKISFNKIVLIATHVVSDIEFIAKNVIMLKKGVITDNAPPHELIRKIEGRVWLVPCEEQEVQSMQHSFRVTSIGREEESGRALLRILAEEKPADNARSIAPTLEDYYLDVFGNVDQNEKKD